MYLIRLKLQPGDVITSRTSRFIDQQSRNVSLCSSRRGKRKHIKLFDITFSRTG